MFTVSHDFSIHVLIFIGQVPSLMFWHVFTKRTAKRQTPSVRFFLSLLRWWRVGLEFLSSLNGPACAKDRFTSIVPSATHFTPQYIIRLCGKRRNVLDDRCTSGRLVCHYVAHSFHRIKRGTWSGERNTMEMTRVPLFMHETTTPRRGIGSSGR
jgi:hypothetical protein